MEYMPREQLINELQNSLGPLMETYNLDEIGVFEEEGREDRYHAGYTVGKDGKAYMVHRPYIKNEEGHLASAKQEWTVETDEPNEVDQEGYENLDDVLQRLFI